MNKIAMAVTMVVLAAAPVTAQQAEQHERAEHPHQCPHHQAGHEGAHGGGEHAMGQHEMGGHEMGEHHAAMQEMHGVMMMMHHPEMLDLTEAQVEQLAALRDRVHADGMNPMQHGPEAMKELVEEARSVLTAEQRERLAEMDHPMGEECPMMKHGEGGGHGGHGGHGQQGAGAGGHGQAGGHGHH